jgi:prophage tail gpP-like protein
MPTARVSLGFSDGTSFDEWQTVTLRDTFVDPLGEFNVTSSLTQDKGLLKAYRQTLRKGELVSVKIDDIPQFVGLIQTVEKTIGDNGITFAVSGGTPLITPYEGAAVEDPTDYSKELSFHSENADVPVADLIKRVMRPYFGADPVVIGDDGQHLDLTSGKKRTKKARRLTLEQLTQREAIAHPGETAYGLLSRVITKLGVCLKLRWDGTLMITRPDYDQEISYTIGQSFATVFTGDRFFGDVKIRDTNEGQFSECVVRGQIPDDPDATTSSRPIGAVLSTAINATRPPYSAAPFAAYKPKVIKDKSSRDLSRAQSTAKLTLGLAASNAFVVLGVVEGWKAHNGRVWTPGTLARVVVEIDEIDETMFLLSRTFIQEPNGGQYTQLTFIPKGYLVLGDLPGGD